MGWIEEQLEQYKVRKQAREGAKERDDKNYVDSLIKRAKKMEADNRKKQTLSRIYQEVPDVFEGDPLSEMNKFSDKIINANIDDANKSGLFGDILSVISRQSIPKDNDPAVIAANKLDYYAPEQTSFTQRLTDVMDKNSDAVRDRLRSALGSEVSPHWGWASSPRSNSVEQNTLGYYTSDEMDPRNIYKSGAINAGGYIPIPDVQDYFDNLYKDVGGLDGLRRRRAINAQSNVSPENKHEAKEGLDAYRKMVLQNIDAKYGQHAGVDPKTIYPPGWGGGTTGRDKPLQLLVYPRTAQENLAETLDESYGKYAKRLGPYIGTGSAQEIKDGGGMMVPYGAGPMGIHTKYVAALQDVESPKNPSITDRLNRLGYSINGDPRRNVQMQEQAYNADIMTQNLSGARAMFGRPILNKKDAAEFMDWVDDNEPALRATFDKQGYESASHEFPYLNMKPVKNNPILKYLDTKNPTLRKDLQKVMQVIVQNKDDRPKENYA